MRLPLPGQGVVDHRRPVPAGDPGVDVGLLFNSDTRRLVGLYGVNPTDDLVWTRIDLPRGSFRLDLPPRTPRRTVSLPRNAQIREEAWTRTRDGVVETGTRLRYNRVIHREFARPQRSSPVLLSITSTESATNATSHAIDLPSTVDAGDGLLIVAGGSHDDGGVATQTTPTGFTLIGQDNWDPGADPKDTIGVHLKEAVGTEDGGTATIAVAADSVMIGHVYRLEAGSYSGEAEVGFIVNQSTDEPNNPALSPAWGSASTLWIVAFANDAVDKLSTSRPTGYTLGAQSGVADVEELGFGTAYRVNETATESPSNWVTADPEDVITATIGVEPGGAATQDLTGVLFQKAPTFNAGTVAAGAVNLTGTLFQKAPSFNTGTVAPGAVGLTGTLFQSSPTFPTGTVEQGASALTGTLFQSTPTFFAGTVDPGPVGLAGSLFESSPSFFQAAVASTYPLTGTLFQSSPTFNTGTVEAGAVNLTGSLFQSSPTFFTAAVVGGQGISGTLFQATPTFFQGAISAGVTNLTGVLFQIAPVFGTGQIGVPGPTGTPGTAPLTFQPGRVTDPPPAAAAAVADSKAAATGSGSSGTATPSNEPGKAE